MSQSSSSHPTPSINGTDYASVTPTRDISTSVEEDPSEDTEDPIEVSSSHDQSQQREPSPDPVLPQPPLYGLRIRRTARKSVPMPVRITFGGAGPSAPRPVAPRPIAPRPVTPIPSIAEPISPSFSVAGPSIVRPRAPPPTETLGVPVRHAGMTPDEARRARWMEADIYRNSMLLSGHRQMMEEMIARMVSLHRNVDAAVKAAISAEEIAKRVMTVCCIFGGLFMILVMMFMVGLVIRVWF